MSSKAKFFSDIQYFLIVFLFISSCRNSSNLYLSKFELGYKVISRNCNNDTFSIQSASKLKPLIINDTTVIIFKPFVYSTFDPRFCIFMDKWTSHECESKVIQKSGICIINEHERFGIDVDKRQRRFIFTLNYQDRNERFSVIFRENTTQFINDFREQFIALGYSRFEIQCTDCE